MIKNKFFEKFSKINKFSKFLILLGFIIATLLYAVAFICNYIAPNSENYIALRNIYYILIGFAPAMLCVLSVCGFVCDIIYNHYKKD